MTIRPHAIVGMKSTIKTPLLIQKFDEIYSRNEIYAGIATRRQNMTLRASKLSPATIRCAGSRSILSGHGASKD